MVAAALCQRDKRLPEFLLNSLTDNLFTKFILDLVLQPRSKALPHPHRRHG
jgi:hypothetical protein